MTLKARLIEQITLEGPLSVADYINLCLLDPSDGYYTRHVALGAEGDFLTAPLISQMFGEMLGVWAAQLWLDMGSPAHVTLVEIGGGDGTLMSDILRAAGPIQGFGDAADVIMIDPSPTLRARQQAAVPQARFVPSLEALDGESPVIVIANEVLDCLPARQFARTGDGWFERCVGLVDGELTFGLVPAPPDFTAPFDAPLGEIIEISPAQIAFAARLARLVEDRGGGALLIDYGRDAPGTGDTLQSLYRHEKTGPLDAPGHHDLTMWADFPAVAAAARTQGAKVSAITAQSEFLEQLGITNRHAALSARNPAKADVLARQYDRLMAPEQMGTLFKVLGIGSTKTCDLPALVWP